MGYKLLGYAVWRGGKWYLRRRFPHGRRNLAIGGIGLLVLAGAVAFAGMRRNGD